MNSLSYILGFLCGIAVVALVVLLIRLVFKKKSWVLCGEYDERQKAIQGCGYKYAYFTLMIAVIPSRISSPLRFGSLSFNILFLRP